MYYNSGPQINTRSVIFSIMAINVIVYIFCNTFRTIFPYHSPEMLLGMHYPASPFFRAYQIFTHMFMHSPYHSGNLSSLSHIVFNMAVLFMFGTILESVWGSARFLEYYILTGLGAVFLHTAVQAVQVYIACGTFAPNGIILSDHPELFGMVNAPTIGASGAIFGVLAGYGLLFANTEIMLMGVVPVRAKYLVTIMIIYELYRGIANNPDDRVAHFAHLGGALIGFIIIKIWNNNRNSLY